MISSSIIIFGVTQKIEDSISGKAITFAKQETSDQVIDGGENAVINAIN
jgi:hypothetical protein